jgi:hypothetical protein
MNMFSSAFFNSVALWGLVCFNGRARTPPQHHPDGPRKRRRAAGENDGKRKVSIRVQMPAEVTFSVSFIMPLAFFPKLRRNIN